MKKWGKKQALIGLGIVVAVGIVAFVLSNSSLSRLVKGAIPQLDTGACYDVENKQNCQVLSYSECENGYGYRRNNKIQSDGSLVTTERKNFIFDSRALCPASTYGTFMQGASSHVDADDFPEMCDAAGNPTEKLFAECQKNLSDEFTNFQRTQAAKGTPICRVGEISNTRVEAQIIGTGKIMSSDRELVRCDVDCAFVWECVPQQAAPTPALPTAPGVLIGSTPTPSGPPE